MKNILIILLLFSPPYQAQIPKDKILHLGAGALAGGYGYICSPKQDGWMPIVFSVGMASLAGWGNLKTQGDNFEASDIA